MRSWLFLQVGGFTVPGINQANYAQFAAVLAQQAALQRQAQGAQLAQVCPVQVVSTVCTSQVLHTCMGQGISSGA